MREDWAKAWARHMKPGGKLITLIFPVEPEPRDGGPPWYVHPDMYTQVLTANGTRTRLAVLCVATCSFVSTRAFADSRPSLQGSRTSAWKPWTPRLATKAAVEGSTWASGGKCTPLLCRRSAVQPVCAHIPRYIYVLTMFVASRHSHGFALFKATAALRHA